MYHTHRLTAPHSAAGSANVGQLTDSLPTSHQCVWTYRGQEGVVSMHVCTHRIKHITGPESPDTNILSTSVIFYCSQLLMLRSGISYLNPIKELHQHKPKKEKTRIYGSRVASTTE